MQHGRRRKRHGTRPRHTPGTIALEEPSGERQTSCDEPRKLRWTGTSSGRLVEQLEEQLKSFDLKPLRMADAQHIRDEDGNLLRDERRVGEWWVSYSDPC